MEGETGKEFRARVRAQRQAQNEIQAASDISDMKDLGKGCLWAILVLVIIFVLLSLAG